jgi:hypothetical protein
LHFHEQLNPKSVLQKQQYEFLESVIIQKKGLIFISEIQINLTVISDYDQDQNKNQKELKISINLFSQHARILFWFCCLIVFNT